MREIPKSGEKWRHFKGNEYLIVVIAEDEPGEKFVIYGNEYPCDPFIAKHTETGEYLLIEQSLSPLSAGLCVRHKDGLNTKEYLKIWARPLDNFMEVTSFGCYRFARAED